MNAASETNRCAKESRETVAQRSSSIEREIHLALHFQFLRRRLVFHHGSPSVRNIGGRCSAGDSQCRSGRSAW